MPKRDANTLSGLAQWAEAIKFDDLSPAAIEQARLLILDTIGCALAAIDETEPRALVASIESQGGAPQASIIGFGGKTSAANAVLVNGVLLRFLDLNDYFVETARGGVVGGHPSDNIPVALAIGEWLGSSGRDVIAAVVVGYEIHARIKALMDETGPWDGTSVSGFVAPAMAGRLLGLKSPALAHAMALGGARGATPAVMRSGDISAGKYFANALIAQSGTLCALLAQNGVTGPLALFDHPRGLHQVYPQIAPRKGLIAPLAEDCAIMDTMIKAYPCVATAQTLVAAALALRGRLDGGIAAIERIAITMADNSMVRRHQNDPGRNDPQSREAADHSFPFLAAVALTDGALTPRQFEGERWHDRAIRALMARIVMATDAALAGEKSGALPCVLEVVTRDGTIHRESVLRAPGATDHGLERDAVVEKFENIATAVLAKSEREAVTDMVLGLDRLTSIAPLMKILSGASR